MREKMKRNKRLQASWLASVSTVSIIAGQMLTMLTMTAQSNAAEIDDTPVFEEIVVTALRRDQRLQDVPAALSVLGATKLYDRGAKDFRDYLQVVPGVSFGETGYRSSRVVIRGVSDGLGTTASLAGIYIDEVPVTETRQPTFDPSIYDVERVEVLKGPQGTLYGSGSMGGTIRVILNKPQLDGFEGQTEGTIGDVSHGGINYKLDSVLNIPIVTDKLGLRVVGSYRNDSGFIDDTLRNETNANSIEKKNVRVALRWKPSDLTTIDAAYLYQKEDLGTPNFSEAMPGDPIYTQRRQYRQTGPSETELYSFTLNHEFSFGSLVSSTNYLDKFSAANIDATNSFRGIMGMITGVLIPTSEGFGINTEGDYRVFSQEVRLASHSGDTIEWLIGGFYSEVKNGFAQYADLSSAPSVSSLLTGKQVFDSLENDKTRQLAAFGEITWNATEKLALTAGLRVFDIDQDVEQFGSGILAGGSSQVNLEANSSSVNQKYRIAFKPTADSLLYAQAAQGFRQGGANGPVPQSICGADLANLGYSSTPSQYGSDDLWSYEIGSKNTLLDSKATLNAAAYYTKWSNIQNLVSLPTCLFSFTGNAGEAEIKGIDLDTSIQPIEGLSLGVALSYVDAKITETAPGIKPNVGDRLPFVAKWSWAANARYEFPLTALVTAFVYTDVNYVGKRWNTFEGNGVTATQLPSYYLANLRFGIMKDSWTASIFATNLFNKYYAVNRQTSAVQTYDVVGEPRVIGVNLKLTY
ncbi:TonB-dependent receptor [Kordiimonas pumila]|uniref:TonB-dependent receptor n=1 Tax=Kordiimonas pumila TaxID=2161677 RepID=A0ABV7D2X6_9PROT|nr:TonB-dependent receptor [Kordiimonas pumila]